MSRERILTAAGWCVAAAFLAAGVPLFLRTPLWCDVTLYDVAARTVLAGGVHYRDVFDTNPPGFMWVLCGVRALFGPSPEAVRVVDLLIVAGTVSLLLVWARRAGASGAGVAWTSAAIAAFYPFSHEFNHAQRDVWMMLPACAAVSLRLSERPRTATRGLLEGLIWGVGCWIKPHLLFVAAAVWLASASRFETRRAALRDLAAVLAGGVAAGLAGLAWLVGTGAWAPFLDIWRNWNTSYAAIVRRELPFRVVTQLDYFPPYSPFALLAVPLALWNLRDRSPADPAKFRRSLLAAAYLAWLLTALLLQRPFHYVHVPETFLMLALFAANRWPVPALIVLLQVVVGLALLVVDGNSGMRDAHRRLSRSNWLYRQLTERNPAFDAKRMRLWPTCLDRDPPREVRRDVALWARHFGAHDPVELGAAADFLRSQSVGDGELIAWHDSPHALYADLGIRPSFRFMHVGMAWGLGPWQRERILAELQAALPRARFAVSDLYRVSGKLDRFNDVGPDNLPLVLPEWQKGEFPFDQPVVFRSPNGRYLVHRIANPVRGCAIPNDLDQQSPNPGS